MILGASLVFLGGSLLMGVAGSKETLLAGRLVVRLLSRPAPFCTVVQVGAAIGLASTTVPVYIGRQHKH